MRFHLPTAMSAAIPPGSHYFDVEFVDKGIMLTYAGPAAGDSRSYRSVEETPKWAKDLNHQPYDEGRDPR